MPLKFLKAKFNGDPNIGLYGFATDDYCLLGTEPSKKVLADMEKTLKTKVLITTVAGTELLGLFAAGNRHGIILTKIVEDFEISKIKKNLGLNVVVLNSRETALGNLILCNDKGCLIPIKLKRFKREISDVLDCDVDTGAIADFDIVGSVGVANNNGCLCHSEAREEEMKKIEELLKVKVDVGTVGYGSPFLRPGIIVNGNGLLFSETSTGPEIGRLEEVFS